MQYISHPINFGSPVNAIFPKQVDVTIFGGATGSLRLNWGFNFGDTTTNVIAQTINSTAEFTAWTAASSPVPPEGNAAEWTSLGNSENGILGYWTNAVVSLSEFKYNLWGSGRNLSIGLSTDILGPQVSIQEINIQALQGRIL
jgi:hypothetical protein